MKTRPRLLRNLLAACSLSVLTSAIGQVSVFTWTNQAGGDIATAANWTNSAGANGVPSPTSGPDLSDPTLYGDEMLFDGVTTGALALTANTGQSGFSGQNWGLRIHLTSNQTAAVNIRSVVAQSAGTRFGRITVDAGAGQFSLGDNTANVLDTLWGGSNPATHYWTNNSVNPVVIYPNVRWRYGGGGAHTFDFSGSGDWIVNNYFRNNNNSATVVSKSGTGTMIWTGTNFGAGAISTILIASPVIINDGLLVLKSSDLLAAQNINHNGGRLRYDAATGAGVLSGTISGAGVIEMTAGTLTLSGNNTFTGGIILSNGTLVASRVENIGVSGPLGVGGLISFRGGTLAFSANNAFDYSARFDTAAGQAYSLDTGGQSVTLATGLSSSGGTLTKLGSGTLTLSGASTYSGLTTVNGGRLVFAGAKSGPEDILVANGATLGVTGNGSQVTPGLLTMGTSGAAILEFNNLNSSSLAPVAAGAVSAGGPITININSGTFSTIGQVFPLLTWTSGSAPAVTLGNLTGAAGSLTTNGNTIQLTITGTPFTWTGLNNGNWDLSTANNWLQSGSAAVFGNGLPTVIDDTATGATSITIGALVQPAGLTVSTTNAYTIASSGASNIGGSAGLTKNGSGTLTLSGGANTYTGVTTINAGTINISALGNSGAPGDLGAGASAGSLLLNGGAVEYAGLGESVNRLFTIGSGGGAIRASGAGTLVLNNTGALGTSGSGARTLTLAGSDVSTNTMAARIVDGTGGATALVKDGAGTWVLTGTNSYTGVTTVSGGVLQVGAGSTSGLLGTGNVVNNAGLVFNRAGTVTNNAVISGNGAITNEGPGTIILAANNTYRGGTTINFGTLQVGNGGSSGELAFDVPIVNNSLLIFNSTGAHTYLGNGRIDGTGNVIVRGVGGVVKAIGGNTYTGWTQIDSGATFQPTEGNTGQLLSSAVTNNGTLKWVAQDTRPTYTGNIVGTGKVQIGANNITFDSGEIVLAGTNSYTGGTFIGGNWLTLGDGANPQAGSIVGDVTFVNNFDTPNDNVRRLRFNRPAGDDFIFSGNITTNFTTPQNNVGIVSLIGGAKVTFTGNNNYAGGTVIDAGTLVVGNAGTTGSIGSGPATVNGTLVWNRSDSVTYGGIISGVGPVVKLGASALNLTSTNYTGYFGYLTISNGPVTIAAAALPNTTNAFAGAIEVDGGSLIVGAVGRPTVLEVQGTLNVNAGSVVAALNTSLPLSNSIYSVAGGINVTAGTLKLINAGPMMAVGQKFTIFSQPVNGGAGMTIVSPGFTVQNDLAVDGSVTVTAVQPAPTITATQVGNQLNLSWPSTWVGGVHLQGQTNTLAVGISSNWVTIPGTDLSNTYSVAINPTNRTVFFRLVNP